MRVVKVLDLLGVFGAKNATCQAVVNHLSEVIYVSLFARVSRFVLTALFAVVSPLIEPFIFITADFCFYRRENH